jgi:hypothetical protein
MYGRFLVWKKIHHNSLLLNTGVHQALHSIATDPEGHFKIAVWVGDRIQPPTFNYACENFPYDNFARKTTAGIHDSALIYECLQRHPKVTSTAQRSARMAQFSCSTSSACYRQVNIVNANICFLFVRMELWFQAMEICTC